MSCELLLITPPFVQPNAPYPATAYLKGYLSRRGKSVEQVDLSIELLNAIFSKRFLGEVFARYEVSDDENIDRIYLLRNDYLRTIDPVMRFLRGEDPTIANMICSADWLPEASRFECGQDMAQLFGPLGTTDCARHLATLYLQDISDFIRATITDNFEIVKYGEQLACAVADFSAIEQALQQPKNMIEELMCQLLGDKIRLFNPSFVGFTVPFPGNLPSALRCGEYIKENFESVKIVLGGGYPSTELRSLTDMTIFNYVDYIVLDDGERALERIVEHGELIGTFDPSGFHEGKQTISHLERGCPDFSGLPFGLYFSLTEVANPMHRLWSDGRWNKMMLAHGCYWGKCAFCDTTLDYISKYDTVDASTMVDWMEQVAKQSGSTGFHFTDEAAPPKLLKELSLELLRRGLSFSWWTNIRFEKSYTGDLCRLMAAAGCIAVSGGLEVADDRLLKMIGKGITVEQAVIAMRNMYYSGIMVHAYLMYGLPTETLQESVDALERVRQMFRAELIDSAFWHRYAMTLHSHSGQHPEEYGVRRKGTMLNSFANNEIYFADNRGYNINIVGEGLRESLANYMAGEGIERAAHKWFACKAPQTTVEESFVTDCLIKPDSCRLYNPNARIVWIGGDVSQTDQGVVITTKKEEKEVVLEPLTAEFVVSIVEQCANLGECFTFGEIEELYNENFEKPFVEFYLSKKWDILRNNGLLQI